MVFVQELHVVPEVEAVRGEVEALLAIVRRTLLQLVLEAIIFQAAHFFEFEDVVVAVLVELQRILLRHFDFVAERLDVL